MSTAVKCRGCGANFQLKGATGRCPVCDVPYETESAEPGRKPAKKSKPAAAERAICAVCKKPLAPGVKFCAACGTNAGTADAGDAFVAGAKLEEKSRRDIARARWQMFFARMFPWW